MMLAETTLDFLNQTRIVSTEVLVQHGLHFCVDTRLLSCPSEVRNESLGSPENEGSVARRAAIVSLSPNKISPLNGTSGQAFSSSRASSFR